MKCWRIKLEKTLLVGLFVCLNVQAAFSSTISNVLNTPSDLVVGLSAGPVWQSGGQTQTFYLTPEIEKTYSASKSSHALADVELFVGLQRLLATQWLGQLGVDMATSGGATLQGTIWDDANPQFENHSYQYYVQNSQIAIKGKLLMDKGYWLMPWISGSVGIGFNRAYGFTNTPLIFEALPNSNFTSRTTTAFTYSLGIGAQKRIDQHWQMGAGYQFSDWGRSQLGSANGQTVNSGLKLDHLYISGILFELNYLA